MSQRCRVCTHDRRAEIELALARRVALRIISHKHEVSIDSLSRHRRRHMSPALLARLGAAGPSTEIDLDRLREAESEGLLQTIITQRSRLFALLDQAEEVGDYKGAAQVHGKIVENLQLTARLLGELLEHQRITGDQLLASPQYAELRSALVRALRPFPEARQAAARVLQDLEGEATDYTGLPARRNGSAGSGLVEAGAAVAS